MPEKRTGRPKTVHGPVVRVTVDLSEDLIWRTEEHCRKYGVNRAKFLRQCVESFLDGFSVMESQAKERFSAVSPDEQWDDQPEDVRSFFLKLAGKR